MTAHFVAFGSLTSLINLKKETLVVRVGPPLTKLSGSAHNQCAKQFGMDISRPQMLSEAGSLS